MPRTLMEELLANIPKYQAESALVQAQIEMLPHIKKGDRRKVLSSWYRLATRASRKVFTEVSEFVGFLRQHGV